MPKSHSWPATSAAQQAQASLPPEAVQSAGSKRQSWDPQCPQDAAVAVVVKEPLNCCHGTNSHSFIQHETLGDNGKQTDSGHRVYTLREMLMKPWNQPNIYDSKMR